MREDKKNQADKRKLLLPPAEKRAKKAQQEYADRVISADDRVLVEGKIAERKERLLQGT